jgi:phosphatidylinositol 4-kinase A
VQKTEKCIFKVNDDLR